MFRINILKNAASDVAARATLGILLAFGATALSTTNASAQSERDPLLKPLITASEKVQPGQCTGSNTIRFWFLYTNGQIDSGISTSQELTQENLNCVTFEDGDTDLDAATLHLSCSQDYTEFPTSVGNGLTVEDWAIYRLNSNGGVCGNIPFPGHLRIEKQTVPDGAAQPFGFTSPQGAIGNFNLSDNGTIDFFIDPGSYSVSETEPNGWDLTGLTCSDPTNNSNGSVGTATASIDLARDELVHCTFTNTKIASITVKKLVTRGSTSQSFAFTGDLGEFSLQHNETETFSVAAGTYSVNETVPGGWTLDGASCNDAGTSDPRSGVTVAAGDEITCTFSNSRDQGTIIVRKETNPDENPNSTEFGFTGPNGNTYSLTDDEQESFTLFTGNYSVSEDTPPQGWEFDSASCTGDDDGSSPSSIQLDKGETVTCTFNNTQQGKIIVRKETNPSGSTEDFDFESDFLGDFTLEGDGDQAGAGTFLSPGQYNVSEDVPAGWELTGLSCDDGNSVENLGNASAVVNLEAGETVTCTFTNTQDGTINIVKQTDPDESPKVFSFSGDLGTFDLSDGDTETQSFQPGNFSVSETVPFGWILDSIQCEEDATQNSSGGGNTASITLEAGETVTCTFNNVELEAGIAVLKKTDGEESNPGECTGVIPGDTVNWSYEVTNTGDVPVQINSIVDDNGTGDGGDDLSLGSGISFDGGDTNGNGLLDTDETWTYSASGTGAFQGAAEYQNTVTVNGEAAEEEQQVQLKVDLGDPVEASDTSCYVTPGIEIVKSDGDVSVNEGANFEYTLTYTNTGGLPLTNVEISETIPANTTFNAAGTNGGDWNCTGTAAGQTCTFTVGSLGVGDSDSVQFPLTVDELWAPDEETGLCPEEPEEPTVNNTGEIDGDSTAGSVGDEDSDSTPINVSCTDNPATLVINKVVSSGDATTPFSFTGSSSEDGFDSFQLTGTAPNNTASFSLPGGNYSVSETVPFGWELTGTQCSEGTIGNIDLSPGEQVTCTFTNRQLDAEISLDKITNGIPDDFEGCNGVDVGSQVTWTYTVTNPGEHSIGNVSLVDDNGTAGDSGDDFGTGDGSIVFTGGDDNGNGLLDPGETWTYEATGTAISGEYINTATVNGEVAEAAQEAALVVAKADIGTPVTDTDQSRYCGLEFDLSIEKTDNLLFVAEGAELVFVLTYQNTGNVDLTGVTISDVVPVNTTFNSGHTDAGLWNCSGTAAGSNCTHEVGNLAAGAGGSVNFPLLVDSNLVPPDEETGECPSPLPEFLVDNTATIADDGENGPEANTENNTDSDTTNILVTCEPEQQAPPEIQIEKNPDSQLIEKFGTAEFTITVTNPSTTVTLVNVMVSDPESPNCERNIGTMAPGAVEVYNCTRNNVTSAFTNVATATGEDEEGNDVSDDDDARVNVLIVDEPPQQHGIPIPTLSQWALILMAGLMLLLGGRRVREWTRR